MRFVQPTHAVVVRLVIVMCLLATMALVAGCTRSEAVRSDLNPDAELAAYQTFGFYAQLGTDRAGQRTLMSQLLQEATDVEIKARGLKPAEAPQLLINFSVAGRPDGREGAAPYAAWTSHRARGEADMPGTLGTLYIDLVDAQRRQLVWQGAVPAGLHDARPDELRQEVFAAVEQLFRAYPLPILCSKAEKLNRPLPETPCREK